MLIQFGTSSLGSTEVTYRLIFILPNFEIITAHQSYNPIYLKIGLDAVIRERYFQGLTQPAVVWELLYFGGSNFPWLSAEVHQFNSRSWEFRQ